MFKLSMVIAILVLCMPNFAQADVISSQALAARERLRANPNVFDRFDTFCAEKRPGDLCVIQGNTFAGGGKGVCTNIINDRQSIIDLSCVRSGTVQIDRKLPTGGFVNDEDLCGQQADTATKTDRPEKRQWNCTPGHPVPADRFCAGKAVGGRCTAEIVYQGSLEKHEGVCKTVTETEAFYYRGRRIAKRDVIRCEPERPTIPLYAPANWRQKLLQ